MKDFKFFQKKERLTIQWMDEMDDYHLGGIRHVEERRMSPIRTFALNVLTNGIFGRVPSYLTMFERIGDNPQRVDNVNVRGNITIRDLIENSLTGLGLYFLILKIHRLSDGTEVEINYENVDELNAQNLVFNLDDYVTIYCRQV